MTVDSDDINADLDDVFGDNSNLEVLDLRALRSEPLPPPEYLEGKFIQRGVATKFTAESGAGKSILLADMAWHWAVEGRSALSDHTLDEPVTVLYIDGELGQRWWVDYLGRFGAPLDTPRLIVKCFPIGHPLRRTPGRRCSGSCSSTTSPMSWCSTPCPRSSRATRTAARRSSRSTVG